MHYKQLYQIYDTKAETVIGPIMRENKDGPAIRYFYSLLSQKDTLPGQHPQDYQLLYLGNQDEETGEINGETSVVTSGQAWLESLAASDVQPAGVNGSAPLHSHQLR